MVQLIFAVMGEENTVGVVDVQDDAPIHSVKVAIKALQQYSFPATELTLFTTKSGAPDQEKWLPSSSAGLRVLQTTPTPAEVKDKTSSSSIHLVSSIPESRKRRPSTSVDVFEQIFRPSRLAIEWHRAPNDCPQLELPLAASFLRIPRHYLDDSGVTLPTVDQHALLYTRKAVVDEWHTIQEWAVDLPARLWIIGGPGASKSCAAFAFACSLDRATWDVMWMRYEPYQDQVACVMVAGNEKWTFEFPAITAESTMLVLMAPWSLPSSKPLIVFLDGYHKTLAHCETIRKLLMLLAWQIGDPRCRRLVCVTSMASRGKDHNESPMPVVEAENGRKVKVEKQFTLPSWTLDECKEVVKHPAFFSTVRNKLQHTSIESADLDVQATATPATAPDPHSSPQELAEHKFYIAGGNARMMLHDTTSDAIAKLTAAVSTVDDFSRKCCWLCLKSES